MSWYYVENGERRGPVSDADLDALAQAGTIQPQTYVWREGMASWLAFSQVRQAAPGGPAAAAPSAPVDPNAQYAVCTECGRMFPPDEVIRQGASIVCAECKPLFLQKLKEGVTVKGTFVYGGFWIRFGAKFLDGIILQIISYAVGFVVGMALSSFDPTARMLVGAAVGMLIQVAYNTFFVGAYGATPGKMATKLRVVRPDGSPVGYGLACGRCFAEMLSGLILCIGYIMAGFDDEKRALHDRICGTRVIRV